MSRANKIITRAVVFLVLLLPGLTLGFSWYLSGLLVNKPIEQRYDFCSGESNSCVIPMLEKLGLADVQLAVEFISFDGISLKGLYFPSRNGAAVIVQHGYGGHMGNVLHVANMLYRQGYGVITMDLRAHGSSGGEQVTFGRDESRDMQSAFDYLKARDEVDSDKIGIYGWSLGGATVLLHGARNNEVQAVVADSPFDAINYANLHEFTDTPWPLPHLIRFFSAARNGVDFVQDSPIENLAAYRDKPLFILIAGADTIVDPASGERLMAKLNNPEVEVWREPTFGHVRFSFDAPEQFATRVGAFFDQHLDPRE